MDSMKRIQEIMAKHLTNSTSQPSKTLEEMAVESYNNSVGNLKGYDCPICKNKGMVAFLKDGKDYYDQCECLPIRRTAKLQAESGIQMLLEERTFDNFIITADWQKYVVDKAKAYAEKKEGWFFIGGKSGTGKTHICTAMVGQLLKDRVPCKYMLWKDEGTILKARVNDPEYSTLIKPLKEVKCLYIDDFLQDGTTPGSLNLAFEILNYRASNKELMTIISSELTIQDILHARASVGGRIYEMAQKNSNVIHLKNAENYRLKK